MRFDPKPMPVPDDFCEWFKEQYKAMPDPEVAAVLRAEANEYSFKAWECRVEAQHLDLLQDRWDAALYAYQKFGKRRKKCTR